MEGPSFRPPFSSAIENSVSIGYANDVEEQVVERVAEPPDHSQLQRLGAARTPAVVAVAAIIVISEDGPQRAEPAKQPRRADVAAGV